MLGLRNSWDSLVKYFLPQEINQALQSNKLNPRVKLQVVLSIKLSEQEIITNTKFYATGISQILWKILQETLVPQTSFEECFKNIDLPKLEQHRANRTKLHKK